MPVIEKRRLTEVLRAVGGPDATNRMPRHAAAPDSRYVLKVASDRATREGACRLVYEQYLEKGYTQKRRSCAWVTLHDALPETVKLAVEKGGEVVATGTVVPDSPLQLPADEICRAELDALRREGRRPAEVISLAAAGAPEDSRTTLVKLFAAIHLVAQRVLNASDLVITVNPRHAPFYMKMLLFEQIGAERECGKVGGAPAVLLRLRLEDVDRHVREAAAALPGDRILRTLYPLIAAEQQAPGLFDSLADSIRPMGQEDFGHFFVGLSSVLESAKLPERRYLQSRYPGCDFDQLFLTTAVCWEDRP